MKNPIEVLATRLGLGRVVLVSIGLLSLQSVALATITTPARSNTLVVAAAIANGASTQSFNGADYQCTGTSDDVTIQSAITALPATGGSVLLTEGTYKIQGTITLPSNVELRGEGMGVTVLQRTSYSGATANIILTSGASRVTLTDLTLDDNGPNNTANTGGAIKLLNSTQLTLSQLEIKNIGDVGLAINGTNNVLIRGCTLRDATKTNGGTGAGGFAINTTTNPCANIAIVNCAFLYNQTNGIYATKVNNLSVTNCTFLDNAFDPAVGGQIGLSNGCTNVTISGCMMSEDGLGQDGHGNHGSPGSPVYSAYSIGVQLDVVSVNNPSGGTSQFVTISDNVISNMGYAGLTIFRNNSGSNLATAAYCTIKNNVIGDCNNGNAFSGQIWIRPTSVTDFTIEGNMIYTANRTTAQTYRGILVATGSSNNYVIANNNLVSAGATAATALVDGGTGTNKQVYSNLLP